MKNFKFSMRGGSLLSLLILVVFALGCSMDGTEQIQDFDNLKNSENLSKVFNSLDANPEFAEDFREALERSKQNPSSLMDAEIMLRSNKKWASIVNGGGTQDNSFFDGYYISFQAKESVDGMDVGMIKFSDEEGEVVGWAEVNCLFVIGNQAYIRFEIESIPYYIGFQDNGEGANADSDLYTGTWLNFGNPPCEDFADFITEEELMIYEWTEGNVQVD
ncbi:hypothetical protein [Algoriphagus mannitolivorans]|uniref:hypothetical protein n=1 Tax=Algoriphagus mannitolivorans TaxID=226504 RepID=UPI00047CD5C4|nr:hypothetical protein [Algoriphagus mannitolivorans]